MKKILFLIFLCFLIFGIYQFTHKESVLVFSIGNETGDIYYNREDMHITEIITQIEQNEEIDNIPFQQILVKSSKIQLDSNAFFKLTSYERIVTQIKDLEKLLILLRKYCKVDIELILLKDENKDTEYVNKKISILCQKYDIIISR